MAAEFHAYYSRVDSGEPFEELSRTGDYADIIVKLGAADGKLVFWRGSSYLPYWETATGKWFLDELVPRRGDGEGKQHDRVNAFARVALVESTPERVLVYWRYLPEFSGGNPYQGIDPTRFVEESFEVFPHGKITRTIKQGTPRIDDWLDPLNHTAQILQLSGDGIREISRTEPAHSPPAESVVGSPLRGDAVIRPVREWRFDEATGDRAVESITGEPSDIAGHKSLWRKGVSGTALQFDGYNTVVLLPAARTPAIAGALTLEGWFAIGAYPWNWAPMVQQGDDTGYALGVDAHGRVGFKLRVGDTWQELVSANALARFHWHHAAGTYDLASGAMSLYLNGKLVATRPVGAAGITTTPEPIQIG
ncbi:MAG: LamG domain-containing protein, partial [Verrucomicrobia bacterium]|nr:LamG domain-containing protein [Verrucomicrobiota bacterium]